MAPFPALVHALSHQPEAGVYSSTLRIYTALLLDYATNGVRTNGVRKEKEEEKVC